MSDTLKGTSETDNPKELTPDVELAKFFALGAQLVVIEGLAGQDLHFKVCFAGESVENGWMLPVLYAFLGLIAYQDPT